MLLLDGGLLPSAPDNGALVLHEHLVGALRPLDLLLRDAQHADLRRPPEREGSVYT